jgi:WD40 repeat protein
MAVMLPRLDDRAPLPLDALTTKKSIASPFVTFSCLCAHDSFTHSPTIAPDDKYVASGSADKSVRLWKVCSNIERVSWNDF